MTIPKKKSRVLGHLPLTLGIFLLLLLLENGSWNADNANSTGRRDYFFFKKKKERNA